jgi:hypothetical protein
MQPTKPAGAQRGVKITEWKLSISRLSFHTNLERREEGAKGLWLHENGKKRSMQNGSRFSQQMCLQSRESKQTRTHARTLSLSHRGFDTKCLQNWVPERGIIRSGWKQSTSTRETKVKLAYAVSSSPESPDYLCVHENALLATRVPKAQKLPRCS